MSKDKSAPNTDPVVRVFDYVPQLDAFVVTDSFKAISDELGLTEWHHTVWIGRLFTLDNDFGEHWFDNWQLRDAIATEAAALGYDYTDLMVIDPEHFADGSNGPCHTPEFRKAFWTDVLISLHLSLDLMFGEARRFNAWSAEHFPDDYIPDLEERIARIDSESAPG